MPITDYKVTDAERNAVYVQAQADTLSGTAAQNKAVFDAYPELVRDNLDGLCDFLANMTFSHTVDTAAATASKTAIAYFIPVGAIVEISFTNGNTSAAPTIAIDGVTHTITGMPTVAKMADSSKVTYRFRKASSSLVFLADPDYVCEYGTTSTFKWKRWASGESELRSVSNSASGVLTMEEVPSTTFYKSTEVTLTLPTGIFNNTSFAAHLTPDTESYILGVYPQYSSSTSTSLKYIVVKGGASTAQVSFRVRIDGTWK